MGSIKVFDNKCAHRGAHIYTENFGSRPASCKYHGWTYINGNVLVPNPQDFKECEIAFAKLNLYQTEWCGDFLFFAVTPLCDLYKQLDGAAEILENISFNIKSIIDINQYEYECYWPIVIENALEPYHISSIHPQSLALLDLDRGENNFYGENSIWRSRIGNRRIEKQLASFKRFFEIDYSYDGYMSLYLFPFSMISSTFGFSYSLQNFFPLTNSKCKTSFTSRLLIAHTASEGSSKILTSFFESTKIVNRKVFEEDHAICKNIPNTSWSSSQLQFSNALEVKLDHFRQSCRDVENLIK
jgi:phenylpropionate dioxygenase-like ring-hydroxylating dioxygenase large terminal subunit